MSKTAAAHFPNHPEAILKLALVAVATCLYTIVHSNQRSEPPAFRDGANTTLRAGLAEAMSGPLDAHSVTAKVKILINAQLKTVLKREGLPVSGVKATLQERIIARTSLQLVPG